MWEFAFLHIRGGRILKLVFFPFHSILALLCRLKALLHTCTIWMDPSLYILYLFLQRYVLSIMIFISYSYSPKENIKIMYPNAGRLDQVQAFQYQWLPKKILFHCNSEVLMHSTSGLKWIFSMSFLMAVTALHWQIFVKYRKVSTNY